jgi:hypothetical protein
MEYELVTRIKFYTNPPIEYPYNLTKFSQLKVHKLNPFFDYIVDSGVYELVKHGEYNLKKYKILKTFPRFSNVEFTIPDYPSDLLGDDEENILKTQQNIEYFLEHYSNVRLLPVIQSLTENYRSFEESFKHFRDNYPDIKRIGLGNLCMCKNLDYYKRVTAFIRRQKDYSYHIFGMWLTALPLFKYFEPNTITFDGMKWTRPSSYFQKEDRHSAKNKEERIYFFLEYLKRIKALANANLPKVTLDDFF